METEEAHHPLKGAWETGGLIGHGLPRGKSKFERNGLIGDRALSLVEGLEYLCGLLMAAEGDRCRVGRIGLESVGPVGMLEEGDLVALSVELMGGCEAGKSGPHNQYAVRGGCSHENRERSHTPRAISTR